MKKQYVTAAYQLTEANRENIINTSDNTYVYQQKINEVAVVKTVSGSDIFK